jgi:hypothetical protein
MSSSPDFMEWVDEIPTLKDLDGHGGHPGCEYLYCDAAHIFEAKVAGWAQKGPILSLQGPTGVPQPFAVMERGTYIKSVSPESTVQPLYISKYLLEACGFDREEAVTVTPRLEEPAFLTPTNAPEPVELPDLSA